MLRPTRPDCGLVDPTAFAAVRDDAGDILLVRRYDTGNWELPGGRVDLGESASQAAMREVAEETGLAVRITGLVGVFTSPRHVVAYPSGGVRQPFATYLHAEPVGGQLQPDGIEVSDAAWFAVDQLGPLPIHPSVTLRIEHALAQYSVPYID